jgi:hypothetical protein
MIILLLIRQRHSLHIKHGKSEYKTTFYPFLLCGHQIWLLSVKTNIIVWKKELLSKITKPKNSVSQQFRILRIEKLRDVCRSPRVVMKCLCNYDSLHMWSSSLRQEKHAEFLWENQDAERRILRFIFDR